MVMIEIILRFFLLMFYQFGYQGHAKLIKNFTYSSLEEFVQDWNYMFVDLECLIDLDRGEIFN